MHGPQPTAFYQLHADPVDRSGEVQQRRLHLRSGDDTSIRSSRSRPRLQTIHDLLVQHVGEDPSQTLVVFETCDCGGWVYDIAMALGFAVAVANPSHEAWRWTKVKRKTDRDDALKLASMAAMRQLPTVHMPSPQQRQKRRLVHQRRALVQRRTEIKNSIRSIFSQQGLAARAREQAVDAGGDQAAQRGSRSL